MRHTLVSIAIGWCIFLPALAGPASFAEQAVRSGDNEGKFFLIIDKTAATISLFNGLGKHLADSPVLVGQAIGDTSVPGIGERPIQTIAPHERTTPAGRYLSEAGKNLAGENVVWIDYEAAVSLHRLRPSRPHEKRLQRLISPTPSDNRITYGCVNVPVNFYEQWISPTLGRESGVIYVMPEVRSKKEVFKFLL